MPLRSSLLEAIRPGDVLVQHDATIWTWLAKAIAGRPFPHAMLVTSVDDRIHCMESNGSVRATSLSSWQVVGTYEVWRPRCSGETVTQAIAWAKGQDKAPYGYINLVRLALKALLRMPPSVAERCIPGGPVCSQFISQAFRAGGWDPDPLVGDADTRPWDFRDVRWFAPIILLAPLEAGGGDD